MMARQVRGWVRLFYLCYAIPHAFGARGAATLVRRLELLDKRATGIRALCLLQSSLARASVQHAQHPIRFRIALAGALSTGN